MNKNIIILCYFISGPAEGGRGVRTDRPSGQDSTDGGRCRGPHRRAGTLVTGW